MEKIYVTIIAVLASFATLVQAAPKDNTWYLGGKMGWSQFHKTNWYNSALRNDGPTYKSQLGAGAFSGYQVNPYVGFEIGYDWLGRIPYKGDTINGAFKAQGVQLTAKLDYSLTDDLDIYARLGSMVWRGDYNNTIANNYHHTNVSPVLTGGVEWTMVPNAAVRLEYQWFNNVSDIGIVGVRPDNSMLSVGISYRFGQKEKTPAFTPISTSAQKLQTKHFNLKSEVLFDFNESSLKSEGQYTLDQLYNQLNDLNPKDSFILVIGFADRIGAEDYNLNLSKKRAQSVVDYLISKGVQSIRIFSRGMGKSNLVTGGICDNVKDRSELIDCLTPDRRVEIEIKGIKDVITQPTV